MSVYDDAARILRDAVRAKKTIRSWRLNFAGRMDLLRDERTAQIDAGYRKLPEDRPLFGIPWSTEPHCSAEDQPFIEAIFE